MITRVDVIFALLLGPRLQLRTCSNIRQPHQRFINLEWGGFTNRGDADASVICGESACRVLILRLRNTFLQSEETDLVIRFLHCGRLGAEPEEGRNVGKEVMK